MKQVELKPTAKVSVKKSVLKKYKVENQDSYFLKDGTEFEIELFNPLQETILCNVTFNGKQKNEQGLILDPGERVFLERYLDTNNKLLFDTYDVEDSPEVKHAIAKNGLVRVTFHKESQMFSHRKPYWEVNEPVVYGGSAGWQNPNIFFCDSNLGGSSVNSLSSISTTNSSDVTFDMNCCTTNTVTLDGGLTRGTSKSIETGRVEKGDASEQHFVHVNKDFADYAFSFTEFKLLPDTYKPKTSEDLKIKTYCTQCGKKGKPKDKFCSACGNKL